jgi:hypothetical protein
MSKNAGALHPAWQDYRRRRRWFWVSTVVTFGGMFAVAGLTENHLVERHLGLVLMCISVLPLLVLSNWLYAFRCPRCSERLVRRPGRTFSPACSHCYLPRWWDPGPGS